MTNPAKFEARLSAVESRVEQVAADAAAAVSDATAARNLAAARDRDLADLTIKVEKRFDRLEQRVDTGFAGIHAKFDQVDRGFVEMRGRFDQTAAGMAQTVDLLTGRDQ